MPGTDVVAEQIGAQALNHVATLNQISDTYIGIWNLGNTNSDVPADTEFLPHKNNHFHSSVSSIDKRQQVADADILPGGKYRSIVKLFLRYTNQKSSDPWVVTTGWLIAPDLIVTAGHSVFDWTYQKGRLAQAKAYIGYNGKASFNDLKFAVQFQPGSQVATPSQWLRGNGMKAYDLAFIKVQQPFTGIVPIKFDDTPKSALSTIGLVGYAADIIDQRSGEKGAHLYEIFQNTNWNLENSEYTMLEYALDPYGGNSGSPVFRQDGLVSIGTHVYGGNPGLASAIGILGNPYNDYLAAFSVESKIPGPQGFQPVAPLSFVRIPTTRELPQTLNVEKPNLDQTAHDKIEHIEIFQSKTNTSDRHIQTNGSSDQTRFQAQPNASSNQSGFQAQPNASSNQTGFQAQPNDSFTQSGFQEEPKRSDYQIKNDTLGTQTTLTNGQITPKSNIYDSEFFEILKLGIKLSDPILSDILHVHSSIVLGPIGSPLGALAGAILASAGKLATNLPSPIHDFRQGLTYDGVLERAILGEAAFTVVMSMKRRKLEEDGIFADMAKIVNKIAPGTKRVAPYIMHILTAPALRIALNALHDKPGSSEYKPEATASGHETPFAQPYVPSNGTLAPEVDSFLKRLSTHCINHNESKDSFSNSKRIIQIALREAGPVLTTAAYEGLEHLTSTLPDSPSGGPGIPSHKPYIVGLPERAMLGEAALQALMKVPQNRLDESAFDIMAQTIASIGSIVLRSAHGLIEDVGFLVKAIVVVPSINADGIAGENKPSQSTSDRRAKGFSFVNLEHEILNYYRTEDNKPLRQIIKA